jgi:hypothetical protein
MKTKTKLTALNQLTTFQDACKIEGLDPTKSLPEVSMCPPAQQKAILAIAQLMIIVSAANRLVNDGEIWTPDWSNYKEYKYFAYFEMRGSSGFRCYVYANRGTGSGVGSRLAFKTAEAAEHVGRTFETLYKDFMVIGE